MEEKGRLRQYARKLDGNDQDYCQGERMRIMTMMAIAVFLAVLIGFVVLRQKFSPKLEVKWTDICIALIPIVIWMLFAGKIKNLRLGELGFETVFAEAAAAEVEKQVKPVTALPVQRVRTATKGPVDRIPNLVAGKTEALRFQLGTQGYQGAAIREYLQQTKGFLKYLVFEDADGEFVGMADVKTVCAFDNATGEGEFTLDKLAEWLVRKDLAAIKRIPDILSKEDAIQTSFSKTETLARMEKLDRDLLPVVDKNGVLIGTVERTKLIASMLIDISNRLE
ncbi:CBS domain-containing protein [candidate division FCPU426 bacterium]|nr:CBS domain-containing protein [candidate division FCPU426 bacterium]